MRAPSTDSRGRLSAPRLKSNVVSILIIYLKLIKANLGIKVLQAKRKRERMVG